MLKLGARMVPFAGYAMPVQYPSGLMAEHKHCRERLPPCLMSRTWGRCGWWSYPDAALRRWKVLVPMDVVDLGVGKQRYALFTNSQRRPAGRFDDRSPR